MPVAPVELWGAIKAANGTTNISGTDKVVRFQSPPREELKRKLLAAGWTVVVG